jgi:hypothetical protein
MSHVRSSPAFGAPPRYVGRSTTSADDGPLAARRRISTARRWSHTTRAGGATARGLDEFDRLALAAAKEAGPESLVAHLVKQHIAVVVDLRAGELLGCRPPHDPTAAGRLDQLDLVGVGNEGSTAADARVQDRLGDQPGARSGDGSRTRWATQ